MQSYLIYPLKIVAYILRNKNHLKRRRDKNDIDNLLCFVGKRTNWRQIYWLSIDDIRFHPGFRQEKSHGKILDLLYLFYNI